MNSLVDFCLMYEENIRKAISDKREDMCYVKTGGAGTSKAFISDPTAQKAIKNLMPVGTVYVPTGPKVAGKCNLTALKNPEKWLVVVEKTWEHFKNHSKVAYNIMCLRYKQGMVDICDIAKFMRISRQRVYFVLNDIHNFAFKYAKEYGAYKPKPKMLKEGRVIVAKKENAEETTE